MRRFSRSALAGLLAVTAMSMPVAAQDKLIAAFSTVGFAFLPPLVAKAMNLYATENIDADIVIASGDTKALAALIGGGADVGFLSAPTVIRARENGIGVIMVGYCLAQYPTNVVVSGKWAKEHGISANSSVEEKAKALKGATLGITAPGSGSDLIMRFLAKKGELSPDRDMTLSNLGSSDTIAAAFAQGRIDGFALSAPVAENAVKREGAVMIFNLAAGEVKDLDGFLYTAITFRQEMLDRNPQLAVRFLRTQQKALDAIRDDATTEKARDAVWNMYWPKVDKALFDEIWAGWKYAWPKTVEIPQSSLKQVTDFTNLLEAKKVDPVAAAKSFTNIYAKEAVTSISGRK
ncbi:ABC transporter substrate-binding protein [Xanthobacter sp. VNH20]|uniref:ABC transporter substrate-binding protein n=1 Tax=Xanthobacter sp. VNH20 TaxID=3156616 RepID=UPI0032B5BDF3